MRETRVAANSIIAKVQSGRVGDPGRIYTGRMPFGHGSIMVRSSASDAWYPLNPRLDLANHSPDGFGWGYSGSGAAQTALAILADFFGIPESAEEVPSPNEVGTVIDLYQRFKFKVVSKLPKTGSWSLSGEAIELALLEMAEGKLS